jgi:glucose/arabinose dehydrogenase
MRRYVLVLGLVLAMAATHTAPATQPADLTTLTRAESDPVLLVPLPGFFRLPVAMAQHPESDDLYIVEKTGQITALRAGLVYDSVLDVSSEVSSGLEQGLLGLAFAPDGEHLYINLTDRAGDTHVIEYAFADGAVDVDSRREVLVVEQPLSNHNAGSLVFGPDGYLYIGLGDGGGAGDPEYNSQRLETLLGSMLRIDPRPTEDASYSIPPDNPFVPDVSDDEASDTDESDASADDLTAPRMEAWAYGLRNPWQYSFDRETGDLWIADVGQSAWEEINVQRADSAGGENYGWNHMEGFELYAGRPDGATEPDDHVPPLYAYANGGGRCSLTGGYVYRGEAIEWLQGAYVYADWCEGLVRYLREEDGEVVEEGDLGVTVPLISSFGEDHDGELYAISLVGPVFRIAPLVP